MRRGDKEKNCLELLKNNIQIETAKICFGLTYNDTNTIKTILNTAMPNKNLNKFPDFVFENGFIEHFQITSSKINKKGASHIKKINNFNNMIENEIELSNLENDKEFNENNSKHWSMEYPEHSYQFLVKSFKVSFEKHIKSLEQYNGNKSVGIFMIEYNDLALEMYEDIYNDWIDEMSNGDLRKEEYLSCYRLTRDKKLLDYVYQFRDKLKYIFFVYNRDCEIIKIENIPYLIKLMPWNYRIESKIGTTLISSIYKV